MEADLAFALELAAVADTIALERFRRGRLTVETKPDLTPVSDADRAVETALRERIARDRPGYAVVGEEFGSDGDSASRFILDPIDGTRNYVRGIPIWATLIAVERERELVAGVASAPALGRRWWAASGEGAFVDGTPISVSSVPRVEDALFLYASARTLAEAGLGDSFIGLARRSWFARGFGDFWQHMLVAEGCAEFAVEPVVELWDLAAVKVIVEEAGGRFTDFTGAPTAGGGSAISSNGLLHDEVLAAFSR